MRRCLDTGTLEREAAGIDEGLAHCLRSWPDVPNLRDAAEYALGLDDSSREHRGKRIRSVLCAVVCRRLGGDPEHGLKLAAIWELLHHLAIVHDDIEDEDQARRGRDAVWVKYGVAHAINLGDYLYSVALRETLDLRRSGVPDTLVLDLLDLLAETAIRTSEGQALDIGMRARRDISLAEYYACVRAKTGDCLIAPAIAGARLAGAPVEVLAALRGFGHDFGPAYQIRDDLIDLTPAKGRDGVGADVREGKRSSIVVLASARCSDAERARMFEILDRPRAETTEDHVAEAIALFEKTGAIDAARGELHRCVSACAERLRALPSSLAADLGALAQLLR